MTYCGSGDTIAGEGKQSGYFWNDLRSGDRAFGTFEATVRPDQNGLVVEGTWQFSGGSGKFEKVSGSGHFRATSDAQGNAAMTWEGSYRTN